MAVGVQRYTVEEFDAFVLRPENAAKRFEFVGGEIVHVVSNSFASETAANILAEIRMYHTRGLLQDDHFLLAYQRKLNNDQLGTALATGTEEERKQVIAEWLP